MTVYNGRLVKLPVWGRHDTLRGGCLAFLPEHSWKRKSVTSTSKVSCLIQKCHVCFSTVLKGGQASGRIPVLRLFAHFCVRLLGFCVRFASNSARRFCHKNEQNTAWSRFCPKSPNLPETSISAREDCGKAKSINMSLFSARP